MDPRNRVERTRAKFVQVRRPIPVPLAEIERNASSYVDPQSYLFHYHGTIYRAVRHEAVPFYRAMFHDGIIDRLIETRHLVPSAPSDLRIDDAEIGLVIEHQTIEPSTYCVEWCPAMLKDAASATLELLAAVLDYDAILQDAYPWNVLFRGTEPVFVDLTSIVEIDTPYLWPAYDQFLAFFLRPLELAAQGKGAIARLLLMNNIGGISRDEAYKHASTSYKMGHPLAGVGHLVDRYVQRNAGLKSRIRRLASRPPAAANSRLRTRFYDGLRRKLERFRFPSAGDPWTTYYADIAPDIDKEAKLRLVAELLERTRPETVLDLGCNTGVFSLLAAERGARVISIDSSEECIGRLYQEAKARALPITPLVSDVLCPTPAFGFMGTQYPPLGERARSEAVLCLGLMHHLHISGRQSFDRIARLLDSLASRHVIFEFVAMDDDNNDLLGAGRRIHYDLDHVLTALRRYFHNIETSGSDRSTRKILICSKEAP